MLFKFFRLNPDQASYVGKMLDTKRPFMLVDHLNYVRFLSHLGCLAQSNINHDVGTGSYTKVSRYLNVCFRLANIVIAVIEIFFKQFYWIDAEKVSLHSQMLKSGERRWNIPLHGDPCLMKFYGGGHE